MEYKEITEEDYRNLNRKKGRYKVATTKGLLVGRTQWFVGKILHRECGPAVTWTDRGYSWYKYGKFHRVDGPAVRLSNGDKLYYLDGKGYSKEEWFSKLTKEQLAVALANPENF